MQTWLNIMPFFFTQLSQSHSFCVFLDSNWFYSIHWFYLIIIHSLIWLNWFNYFYSIGQYYSLCLCMELREYISGEPIPYMKYMEWYIPIFPIVLVVLISYGHAHMFILNWIYFHCCLSPECKFYISLCSIIQLETPPSPLIIRGMLISYRYHMNIYISDF